jgi:predicted kinase
LALDSQTFTAVERFSDAFLLSRRELLAERAAGGRVREGHGDLRAEHIVLEGDRVTIYDCVEFDQGLRCVDVAADLAFLVMDLERLEAGDLVPALERAYVEVSGDEQLSELLSFYSSYRAWVRAKVACLRTDQLGPGDAQREEVVAEARSLFALSHRFAWRARLPLVIVFCGISGSGKSVLAEAVSKRSGLPHVSSDVVRKGLAGVPVSQRGDEEIYGAELSAETYEELARRARAEVEAGRGALVDATFLKRRYRARLVQALNGSGAPVLFCECRAPTATLRRRSEGRAAGPEWGSDATWEVIRGQFARYERLDDVPAQAHLVVRTDRPIEECLEEIEAFVSRAVDSRA